MSDRPLRVSVEHDDQLRQTMKITAELSEKLHKTIRSEVRARMSAEEELRRLRTYDARQERRERAARMRRKVRK